MTKEQKVQLVEELTEKFRSYSSFYVTDTTGMSVDTVTKLRRKSFEAGIPIQVVKNSLIKKALANLDSDYTEAFPALKQQSAVFFTNESTVKEAAKLILAFRGAGTIPSLKVACIDTAFFIGDDKLKTLSKLKSKNELIGEVVGLLQSPMSNVLGAINSGSNILGGLVKTLSERA